MDGATFTAGNEGCGLVAYMDTRGKWTLGRGRHEGIVPGMTCTMEQANQWFDLDDYPGACGQAMVDLGQEYWDTLDEVRRAALADMAFEMGETGLGKFTHLLAAMRASSWGDASAEVLNSLYKRQVPARAKKIADMILTGEWPND